VSKEKLLIGYSRLTGSWYYTGGRTKVDITEEIEAVLEDKNKQIAYLEAKLAESEETINNLEQQCLICNKDKENEKLKQQLAEKEKWINTYFVSQTNKLMTPPTQHQDKISFAVEQLEKLKKTDVVCMNRNGNVYILGSSLNEVIDNQIEELKKEMK
jgi:TolA-binding protein